MPKKKLNTDDNFLTFMTNMEAKSNINQPDRDLAGELYKKNWQASTIDAFEKATGIVPKYAKPNVRYKNRLFSPGFVEDSQLLNELMNHPKYSIIYSKDNWTVDGNYKMFVIYSENLDYKEPTAINNESAKG